MKEKENFLSLLCKLSATKKSRRHFPLNADSYIFVFVAEDTSSNNPFYAVALGNIKLSLSVGANCDMINLR